LNGVTDATKDVTLAGHTSQTVNFTTSRDKVGTYEVSTGGRTKTFTVNPALEKKPGINFWFLLGMTLLAIVIGILVWRLIRRRTAS
jgi:hypothetical protein